jgi:hypothetical protein
LAKKRGTKPFDEQGNYKMHTMFGVVKNVIKNLTMKKHVKLTNNNAKTNGKMMKKRMTMMMMKLTNKTTMMKLTKKTTMMMMMVVVLDAEEKDITQHLVMLQNISKDII